MNIDEKIEEMRITLHESIENNGILGKQTIKISQQLGVLIVEKQRELMAA